MNVTNAAKIAAENASASDAKETNTKTTTARTNMLLEHHACLKHLSTGRNPRQILCATANDAEIVSVSPLMHLARFDETF